MPLSKPKIHVSTLKRRGDEREVARRDEKSRFPLNEYSDQNVKLKVTSETDRLDYCKIRNSKRTCMTSTRYHAMRVFPTMLDELPVPRLPSSRAGMSFDIF